MLVKKLELDSKVQVAFNPRFQGTHFVSQKAEGGKVEAEKLSIPVFRGLILLGDHPDNSSSVLHTFNPRFQGTHFVRSASHFLSSSQLNSFNPRFQGTHFVRTGIDLSAIIPTDDFQSPFSGDSFC